MVQFETDGGQFRPPPSNERRNHLFVPAYQGGGRGQDEFHD